MTQQPDPKPAPEPTKTETYWPTALVACVGLVCATFALVRVPTETWGAVPWETIAGLVIASGAGGALTMLPGLFRKRPTAVSPTYAAESSRSEVSVSPAEPAPLPEEPITSRRPRPARRQDGHAAVDVMLAIVSIATTAAVWWAGHK